MRQTFGRFISGLALRKIRPACSVVLYVEKRTDAIGDIKTRIHAALKAEKIDSEYHERLLTHVKVCHELYEKAGKLVDERDQKDWDDLGNGAKMKKVHKDSELRRRRGW